MAGFRKIALLLLGVLYPAIGHMLVRTEDKLADCLLASFGGLTHNTISIRIEVEDAKLRRNFEDTVSRFLDKNDAYAVDLDSKESCSIFNRLYFVDSAESFEILIDRQRSRNCDTSSSNQYYVVVLPTNLLLESQYRTVEKILNFCWKEYILNVNVLIEDENKTVTLYTYYPFTKFLCRDSTPTIHNRFINGSFEWNKELFPKKLDNLWQCPIKAIVWHQPPFISIEHNQIYGLNAEILKTLSKMMNFSIELVMSPDGRGVSYPNISVTGAFKLLEDCIGDLILGEHGCIADTRTHFASTVFLYSGYLYAAVRRPKLYRNLDVIFLPFDWITWTILFVILLAKWIGELLWKKYGNRCVAFQYCSTRLHTMAWLYVMFIVRSSYEGSIFRFLQKRPTQWIPQNIDEAIDNGYKFVVNPSSYYILKQFPQLANNLVSINASRPMIFRSLPAYKGNYAAIGSDIFLSTFNNDPSIYEDYGLTTMPISMINYCMSMQKYSFLTDPISTRIHGLLENGYMLRNYVMHVQMHKLLNKGKSDERASISLHHIKGAFILLAVCTVTSILVFVAELFAERYPRLKKLLKLFY